MGNMNTDKNSDIINKQADKSKTIGKKVNKTQKESMTNKKDVDEFDLSDEYFTKTKLESDGEDF